MDRQTKIFVAIILCFFITFVDKIDIFYNNWLFGFLTLLIVYFSLFMHDKEDNGILILLAALYILIWNIRLIRQRTTKKILEKKVLEKKI